MTKVGILSSCMHSMFSGGLANSTIALLECFKTAGYEVVFLNIHSNEWFDDCKSLQKEYRVVKISKDEEVSTFNEEVCDLMVELVPYFIKESERKKYAKRSVVFHRKNMLIPTIEHSLYPIITSATNYNGVDEVWCFDSLITNDEIQILETITRKPVKVLPYVWTSSIIKSHETEVNTPLWIQVQASVAQQNEGKLPLWTPHITETNISNSSSCTLPLVILRQAKLNNFAFSKYVVHNSEQVFKSDFFKDNVLRHCNIEDVSSNFVGRQRLMDLVFEPMSCVVSHVRFIPFKPYLFDLAWYGIPFIHNSQVLKDLPTFDKYYYSNNSVSEAFGKLKQMHEDLTNGQGWFNNENVKIVRNAIMERYSSFRVKAVEEYKKAIEQLLTSVEKKTEVVEIREKKKKYVLLFTDMWDMMNPSYNFFTLLLQNAAPDLDISFYNETTLPNGVEPNAIIFGPFGNSWRAYPNVPKIHFTGENSPIVQDNNVVLNLGFQHSDLVGEEYLRFPLWILEIDWFNCDVEKIMNPKPIPLDACTRVWDNKREKFCAFIVTNPCNELRNKAFEWLSEYKDVDSAGRLFNNIGDKLFAGLGGGGGELKKFEFLQNYKFALAFENSSSQGYTTEKLLHAKAAGAIPVYWGDPKVERDFNLDGCIDARGIKTKEDLIELVKSVDNNDELYAKKMSVPALDSYKVDWCRRTMSELARRILKILSQSDKFNQTVPRFVGDKESKETFVVKNPSSKIEDPVMVTFATREFLPSLNQWLAAVGAQKRVLPNLECLVYFGNDVDEEPKKRLLETFPFMKMRAVPNESPENFKDMWEPQHFVWKLWIYQDMVNNLDYKDRLVFYMDAGCFLCRWPTEYLRLVQENDICVLDDEEQKNVQWCNENCVKTMNVSVEDLEKNQIVGGIMAFRAGTAKAMNYFNEAWKFGQMRDVIVGEKWAGMRNGKPYGHRHDQSILSVLSLQQNLTRYPLHNIYCDKSLRRTYLTNKHIYVHRGYFKIHEQFTDGIDDCFVINLKRRADRMEKLYNNHPELKNRVIRFDAIEGKNLQLTPSLTRLFKPHDFMWKKAVMGCALSQLSMWMQLMNEKPDINNYLILEDDVKLSKGWEAKWKEALPHIPQNYDIIYLGGILPPNRAGFEHCKDRVNKYFSRVKENNFYGQTPPNRYFHFCAYAYVLSKQGAEKVIATILARDGYYTSADHILCNPVDFLNIYFFDPLVAGCFQDDDPAYANSQFNNFTRVDKFDSDLWNNDERFSNTEVNSVVMDNEIDIMKALNDARASQVEVKNLETKNLETVKTPINKIQIQLKKVVLYTLQDVQWNQLYEKKWLEELFGNPDMIEVKKIDFNTTFETNETPIFLAMRPHLPEYIKLFTKYESMNQPFKVLHLSDEFCEDPIDFYNFSNCKKVVRNYVRPNLSPNVTVIPLGYHTTFKNGIEKPYERTPQLPFRKYVWSFFGTNWNNRSVILDDLKDESIGEYRCELYKEWNDSNSLSQNEYMSMMLNSWIVPCIGGNNPETYRFYEALEFGCVPIIVEDDHNKEYIKYVTQHIPILPLKSWSQARSLLKSFIENKEAFEQYRHTLLTAYSSMKKQFQDKFKEFVN